MKERPRRIGKGRTVLAFALGATAGSILALLYAPASGKVTRRRLVMRAQTARRAALRKLGTAQREFAHKAEEVRETATEWIAEHLPNGHARPGRRRVLRHA